MSGRLKWSLPVGTRSLGCVTADVDGDGRQEFLLGTADSRLLAIGAGSADSGRLEWEAALPAAAGVLIVCDADGDDRMDILVGCGDGKLYCLRSSDPPPANTPASSKP